MPEPLRSLARPTASARPGGCPIRPRERASRSSCAVRLGTDKRTGDPVALKYFASAEERDHERELLLLVGPASCPRVIDSFDDECAPNAGGACGPDGFAHVLILEAADTQQSLKDFIHANAASGPRARCELMLNEYSRRHFVDGRGLRLPVVAVRPGAPNAAATGAYSNAVREPLAGKAGSIVLPPDLKMPVTSYQLAADNMIALMDVEQERLGIDRMYMQPSLSTDCAQLHAAARELAAERRLPCGGLDVNVDPVATRIVGGMARATDGARARALGLRGDESAASIVQLYARDNLPPA